MSSRESDAPSRTLVLSVFVILGVGLLAAITLSVLAYVDKKKTTTVTQSSVAAGATATANKNLLTQGDNMSISFANDSFLVGLANDINVTSISTSQLNMPQIPTGSMLYADASGNLVEFSGNSDTSLKFLAQSDNGAPTWESPGASTGTPLTVSSSDANLNVTLGGTPTTAVLSATSISVDWQGQLSAARGGTGFSSYTAGDMIYAYSSNTLAKLAGNSSQNKMFLSSMSGVPSWSGIAGSDISGTIPATQGGTGETSFTDGQMMIGSSTGNTLLKSTLTGTANQVIVTNGPGSITFTLPQDIGTGSNVQFGQVYNANEVLRCLSGSDNSVCIVNNLSSIGSNLRSVIVGRCGNAQMTGSRNQLYGIDCATSLTTGSYNVIMGDLCAAGLTTGTRNVLIGANIGLSGDQSNSVIISGSSGVSGYYVIALGTNAGHNNTGNNNVFAGFLAGAVNTSGEGIVCIGGTAAAGGGAPGNISFSTAVGTSTMQSCIDGAQGNSLFGYAAGFGITSGSYNALFGWQAGRSITDGVKNVCLGSGAGFSSAITSNELFIHNEDQNSSNSLLYGQFNNLYLRVNNYLGVGMLPSNGYNLDVNGTIRANSSVVCSAAALGTSATSGFLYIPTCAGAPSGTPVTHSGTVALAYDTTNEYLYVYNGAWKRILLA